MNQLDNKYWTERYAKSQTGWDTGSITPPLQHYFDQLSNKELKILIPGGGNGHEAEYLHRNGFKNVFALDISPLPLQNLHLRYPQFPEQQLLEADFFKFERSFDLIVEQTFFCALNPSLRPQYVEKMHNLLNPKGKLMGLLFDAPMNESEPPFGGKKEDYRKLFEPYFKFLHFEPCYNSIKPRAGKELFFLLEKKG